MKRPQNSNLRFFKNIDTLTRWSRSVPIEAWNMTDSARWSIN